MKIARSPGEVCKLVLEVRGNPLPGTRIGEIEQDTLEVRMSAPRLVDDPCIRIRAGGGQSQAEPFGRPLIQTIVESSANVRSPLPVRATRGHRRRGR